MKTTIKNIVCISMLIGCNVIFGQTEDNVFLDLDEVSSEEGNSQIENALDRIRLHGQPIPSTVAVITENALGRLRVLAGQVHDQANCQNYVLGVKMSMAAFEKSDGSYEYIPLLQPVALCRTSTLLTAPYSVVGLWGPTYTCSSSDCVQFGSPADEQRYRENVEIDKLIGGFRPFLDAEDKTGDIRSLVYPLKELEEVIAQNRVDGANAVIVYSVSYRDLIGLTTYTKHSLLLGPGNTSDARFFDGNKIVHDFRGKFADRANLCPPDCFTVWLTRIQE